MEAIYLETGGQRFPAMLNDTAAAADFRKRLPITLSCRRDGDEYYATSANGVFHPKEIQYEWKNGDILQWKGWFVITLDGEADSRKYGPTMVIGHVPDFEKLRSLPENLKITVGMCKEVPNPN